MLITGVALHGRRGLVDVRCRARLITEVGHALAIIPGEQVIAGGGGALLPGLHDHHMHLFALAALCNSVQCGPPQVSNHAQLVSALQADTGSGWIRGVGYHESVAGHLDRSALDRMLGDRPVKIQHRSGKLWIVNSLGAQQLALHEHTGLPGIDLDGSGNPNGRLFRLDHWMRRQLADKAPSSMPSVGATSRRLASFGVTGLTDTSPDNNAFTMAQFVAAATSGELLQDVRVMGGDDLPRSGCEQVYAAERKVMLDESNLPDWDSLCTLFSDTHRRGRAVAVHCVTPAELVLALSVLRAVGPHSGDRIEHASLVPAGVLPLLREVGVRVVTQPGFIYQRGDQYLADIAPQEHGDLYRCGTLLTQGIRLAGSTDAPYGDPDPWAAMRAAVTRQSRCGGSLGQGEILSPEQALDLFTCAADDAGGASRRIEVGGMADLCLLSTSWEEARSRLRSEDVLATISKGTLIHDRGKPLTVRSWDDAISA